MYVSRLEDVFESNKYAPGSVIPDPEQIKPRLTGARLTKTNDVTIHAIS